MRRDLIHIIRRLRLSAGFTAMAIGILALGIGGTVALFSVVNALLLRPLPYPAGDRLAVIWETGPRDIWARMGVAIPDYEDWRARRTGFEEMAAYYPASFNFASNDDAERLEGQVVSSTYFSLLGTLPALGRTFTADEDREGVARLVVISHGLWKRALGGDSAVVGRSIQLNGGAFTVIGVMPAGFRTPTRTGDTDIWAPLGLLGGNLRIWRATHPLTVLGRLRPGATFSTSERDVNAAAREIWSGETLWTGWRLTVVPLRDELVGDLRPALLALWGAAGLVLMITCANLANLLLARGAERRREFAVRTALGASRWRLMRDVLGEGTVIAVAGGALGFALAVAGVASARTTLSPVLPQLATVNIDLRVLAFACVVVVVTALLFGFAPAATAARVPAHDALRAGGRALGGPGSSHGRSVLVAGQIALSMTLLIGAALLIGSLRALNDVDPGFRSDGTLTFRATLAPATYPEAAARVAVAERVRSNLAALPEVSHVGYGSSIPFAEPGTNRGTSVFVEGRSTDDRSQVPSADIRVISEEYLPALGAQIVRGRNFRSGDDAAAPRVALVSATMARRVWPDGDPIGAQIRTGDDHERVLTVVGVVGDMRNRGLREAPVQEVYVPFRQRPAPSFTIIVRTLADPASIVPSVRAVVADVDQTLPIYDVATMRTHLDRTLAVPALAARLAAGLAALAAALALLGLYAVVAYSVSQRTREFAVRMALGARRRQVIILVASAAAPLVAGGVAVGLLLARAGTGALRGLLYGVVAVDLQVYATVAIGLTVITGAATLIPAWRAARVEPLVALRDG